MCDFFEGREKLVRVQVELESGRSLLEIGREFWEDVLKQAGCLILSEIRVENAKSYLLSESSLFLWDKVMLLKTCGTTTPLLVLPKLFATFPWIIAVSGFLYSHGAFLKPNLQPLGHRSDTEELIQLKNKLNKCLDIGRWQDYVCRGTMHVFSEDSSTLFTTPFTSSSSSSAPQQAQFIEIQMSNFNFNKETSYFLTRQRECIDKIFEKLFESQPEEGSTGWILDKYHFDPCGFSLNALDDAGQYATIHVTPEHEFSYASYETDVVESISEKLETLVQVFEPADVLVILYSLGGKQELGSVVGAVHKLNNYSVRQTEFNKNGVYTSHYKCTLNTAT